MDLFDPNPVSNILPYDGEAIYYGQIINNDLALHYFNSLMESIAWKNDETIMYGKRIVTKRKVAWYGDSEYKYAYANTIKQALVWTKELLELKKRIEERTGHKFNSCLLNLYHTGEEGMTWHSDDETVLGKETVIASLSLGADRNFAFKHKESKKTVFTFLQKGALLVMKGTTQTHWLHSLPKTKKVKSPRINLTFRTIVK